MRTRLVLMGLVIALAAGGSTAPAANPHAQTDLVLSQDGCSLTATATWSSTRISRVDFYFVGVPGGQFFTPSVSAGVRPSRDGILVASATVPPSFANGRVTAIFVDPKEDYARTWALDYSLACT